MKKQILSLQFNIRKEMHHLRILVPIQSFKSGGNIWLILWKPIPILLLFQFLWKKFSIWTKISHIKKEKGKMKFKFLHPRDETIENINRIVALCLRNSYKVCINHNYDKIFFNVKSNRRLKWSHLFNQVQPKLNHRSENRIIHLH